MTIFTKLRGSPALALALGASLMSGGKAAADQVIPDDLIVQGATCVGLDCLNNMGLRLGHARPAGKHPAHPV
jgi:hypothetical protein